MSVLEFTIHRRAVPKGSETWVPGRRLPSLARVKACRSQRELDSLLRAR